MISVSLAEGQGVLLVYAARDLGVLQCKSSETEIIQSLKIINTKCDFFGPSPSWTNMRAPVEY